MAEKRFRIQVYGKPYAEVDLDQLAYVLLVFARDLAKQRKLSGNAGDPGHGYPAWFANDILDVMPQQRKPPE